MELWCYDNDNDESHSNFVFSGSLHFRIKFYCSDEDESSELFCFCHQDDSRPISLEGGDGCPQQGDACVLLEKITASSRTEEQLKLS